MAVMINTSDLLWRTPERARLKMGWSLNALLAVLMVILAAMKKRFAEGLHRRFAKTFSARTRLLRVLLGLPCLLIGL